jgi:regulation of enolase protein 1 (concanavalin A-like superfamily)
MTIDMPALPFALSPTGDRWEFDATSGALTVKSPPESDIFIDPGADGQLSSKTRLNAATLLGPLTDGDFQFSARVTVGFASTFDAGVLLAWFDETHWAKLCFEYSPDAEPMVVSVVARGVADDANGFVVDGTSVWLRVSRVDNVWAYHASLDGTAWRMIRVFTIDHEPASATIGFEAQSPTGDGCPVTFDDIRFSSARLQDLRDGS